MKGLAESLRPVPEIGVGTPQPELVELIDRTIAEDPPVMLADGGFIAHGCDAELDELRKLAADGRKWLVEFQAREQERTGIAKLKVKQPNPPQYKYA